MAFYPVQSFATPLLAFLLLGAPLTSGDAVGGLIIIAGLALLLYVRWREAKGTAPASAVAGTAIGIGSNLNAAGGHQRLEDEPDVSATATAAGTAAGTAAQADAVAGASGTDGKGHGSRADDGAAFASKPASFSSHVAVVPLASHSAAGHAAVSDPWDAEASRYAYPYQPSGGAAEHHVTSTAAHVHSKDGAADYATVAAAAEEAGFASPAPQPQALDSESSSALAVAHSNAALYAERPASGSSWPDRAALHTAAAATDVSVVPLADLATRGAAGHIGQQHSGVAGSPHNAAVEWR